MFDQATLAIIFVSLMALATLLYAILDGYDLGVGILLPLDNEKDADTMVASIGPFWDANETWLVLAVGLLLIAFPSAHSMILKALYLPAVFMLIGLILRGVAFDFRAKAEFTHKPLWNRVFKMGSLLAAFFQGYMLGWYVTGFNESTGGYVFAILSGVGVSCAYTFIGAAWLVMKTEGALQQRAIRICRWCALIAFLGIAIVSVTNLLLFPEVYGKWFSFPSSLFLLPLPIICFALFGVCYAALNTLTIDASRGAALPFLIAIVVFSLSFFGLGYSFFPEIVPGKLTIWESVAAPEALNFILWGAVIVVPTILAYTAYSYRVFWGKVRELKYY